MKAGGTTQGAMGSFLIDRMAEIPWGVFAFLFIVMLGGLDLIFGWKNLSLGDYLGAVSAGAGLLAIGHGVRTRARSAALLAHTRPQGEGSAAGREAAHGSEVRGH
jgi:hypothetical protein